MKININLLMTVGILIVLLAVNLVLASRQVHDNQDKECKFNVRKAFTSEVRNCSMIYVNDIHECNDIRKAALRTCRNSTTILSNSTGRNQTLIRECMVSTLNESKSCKKIALDAKKTCYGNARIERNESVVLCANLTNNSTS